MSIITHTYVVVAFFLLLTAIAEQFGFNLSIGTLLPLRSFVSISSFIGGYVYHYSPQASLFIILVNVLVYINYGTFIHIFIAGYISGYAYKYL